MMKCVKHSDTTLYILYCMHDTTAAVCTRLMCYKVQVYHSLCVCHVYRGANSPEIVDFDLTEKESTLSTSRPFLQRHGWCSSYYTTEMGCIYQSCAEWKLIFKPLCGISWIPAANHSMIYWLCLIWIIPVPLYGLMTCWVRLGQKHTIPLL